MTISNKEAMWHGFTLLLLGAAAIAMPAKPPVTPSVPSGGDSSIAQISQIAMASRCAAVSWSGRGLAPKAYIAGMALAYAKSVCRGSDSLTAVLGKQLGGTSSDALAWYGLKPSIKNLYTLQVGLGMRESSGKYCEGYDTSASNHTASSSEAGPFQTSYDSVGASAELPKLMSYYRANPSKCQMSVWSQGVSCIQRSIIGSGSGADFQRLAKTCPAFAAEYAAVTLRTLRKHYGPLNRKEAQFKNECLDMMGLVEGYVSSNPSVCSQL